MISDYCSRHPVKEQPIESFAEDYVRFIAHTSVPSSLTMSDIATATQKDCVIKCVMDALPNNSWSKQLCYQDDSFRSYQTVSEELTAVSLDEGNVLLRGTRLCIPDSLQQKVVKLAHEGHQGRVRCKALLRETCWFPYMDTRVDEMCKNCIPCMSASPSTTQEPIKPSPLPKQPWDEVSVDFCGPFPSGEYFMVVICDYSRYPVVEKLHSLSAQTVIPHLEKLFSLFSIPSVVKTDNGSPFNSQIFSDFADRFGFKHRKITPLHPMANGTAEAFMKPLVKTMKTASASGKNFKTEISSFLMNYRSTPHPSTGLSPYELMFNRKMKTKLPQFSVFRKDKYVRERDTKAKMKNKRYADIRRKTKYSTIKPGDKVLVKQNIRNKLDTPFSSSVGKVIPRKGSMVTVQHNDRTITRDISHFKPVNSFNDSDQRKSSSDADGTSLRKSGRKRRPPRRFIDE
ncbi:uncharacterized protein K02A2.6-like [Mercenaria mercenaria]|uniref:uncharacterized protein K02A2.6-like n=1 Tax=Mercenaria mercenaria TaxID=6596 RepID=UPI00234EF299|nr:uncharacterized protein K02A2.6-like [Mercenaria mercenaria]